MFPAGLRAVLHKAEICEAEGMQQQYCMQLLCIFFAADFMIAATFPAPEAAIRLHWVYLARKPQHPRQKREERSVFDSGNILSCTQATRGAMSDSAHTGNYISPVAPC